MPLIANDCWRGDHLVATHEPARPVSGGASAIVVSGSAAGIDNAPLLEQPVGRGCIIHCQMDLVEKFDTEPAAARILANLIDYVAQYRSSPRKTAVLGGSGEYRTYLRNLGLRFDEFSAKPAAELSDYALVICRGDGIDVATAQAALWNKAEISSCTALPPRLLDHLRRGLNLDVTVQPYSGHVTRAEGSEPLLEALAREDLVLARPSRGDRLGRNAAGRCDGRRHLLQDPGRQAGEDLRDRRLEARRRDRRASGAGRGVCHQRLGIGPSRLPGRGQLRVRPGRPRHADGRRLADRADFH